MRIYLGREAERFHLHATAFQPFLLLAYSSQRGPAIADASLGSLRLGQCTAYFMYSCGNHYQQPVRWREPFKG
jgi:hypothetical protein